MKELNAHTFKVDDKGLLDHFLGIGFKWNSDGTVFASQTLLIDQLVDTYYKVTTLRGSSTPIVNRITKLDQPTDDGDKSKDFPMRNIVGMMMYLLATRHDIRFSDGQLAKVVSNPSKEHIEATNVLVRYLSATRTYGVLLGGGHKQFICR